MPPVHVSAERVISAPAPAVYALLADYTERHTSILPPAFSKFTVLEGGVGAGTRIRFTLTLAGRAQEAEGLVDEPEPGRILTETYSGNDSITRFTVDPEGNRARLRIETTWESRPGLAGVMERLISPRMLHGLYGEELDLIEQWAEQRAQGELGTTAQSH